MKRIVLILLIMNFSYCIAQTETFQISGTVLDEKTKEPIPFTNVALLKDSVQVLGAIVDFDGNYLLKPITAGEYKLQISFVAYQTKNIKKVKIDDSNLKINVKLKEQVRLEPILCWWWPPLVRIDKTTTGKDFDRNEIKNLANF